MRVYRTTDLKRENETMTLVRTRPVTGVLVTRPDGTQTWTDRDLAVTVVNEVVHRRLWGRADAPVPDDDLADIVDVVTDLLDGDRELWRQLCDGREPNECPEARHTVELHRSRWLTVYLLQWGHGQEAEWHDHGDGADGARVAVRVLKGRVVNEVLANGVTTSEVLVPGPVYQLPTPYVHRVLTADGVSWSVHAYGGNRGGLDLMNFYAFDPVYNVPVLDYGHPVPVGRWERE